MVFFEYMYPNVTDSNMLNNTVMGLNGPDHSEELDLIFLKISSILAQFCFWASLTNWM